MLTIIPYTNIDVDSNIDKTNHIQLKIYPKNNI